MACFPPPVIRIFDAVTFPPGCPSDPMYCLSDPDVTLSASSMTPLLGRAVLRTQYLAFQAPDVPAVSLFRAVTSQSCRPSDYHYNKGFGSMYLTPFAKKRIKIFDGEQERITVV